MVEVPPILFRSFPHQDPMPVPVAGGNPRRVLDFVNLREESDRLLLLCFLVVALVPDIALAALVVHGVQGSGKTYLLNFVRSLLDPSSVAVRGVVSGLDESALSAWQNRLLFFDNLGTVPSGFLTRSVGRSAVKAGRSGACTAMKTRLCYGTGGS